MAIFTQNDIRVVFKAVNTSDSECIKIPLYRLMKCADLVLLGSLISLMHIRITSSIFTGVIKYAGKMEHIYCLCALCHYFQSNHIKGNLPPFLNPIFCQKRPVSVLHPGQ